MKRDKIGIIGAGHVGTHVASALALSGLCGEIVLLDCDEKKAAAAAMDLADPAVFLPRPTVIRAGGYADLERVHQWNMGFVKDSPQGHRYQELADRIAEMEDGQMKAVHERGEYHAQYV